MKKILFYFFIGLLSAQEYSPYKEASLWDVHPLHVGGNAIAIAKADVDRKGAGREGNLVFNKANLFTYFLLPISECTFFLPRVEWNAFTMDWDQNPRFHETHFQFVQFALTFLSQALESWRWIARVDYNIDVKHFSSPREYGLFSLLLWGTHEIDSHWHYHIGALGYTGFEGEEVYPVVGIDYAPSRSWLFQAVFPISYSIEYLLNEKWRLALKGRPLKERFRVGKYEPSPRSVFSYSSMGLELNLHYERFLRLELEFYAGYNFGGSFYLKDRRGHGALYTNVHGAPYAGLSLNWGI